MRSGGGGGGSGGGVDDGKNAVIWSRVDFIFKCEPYINNNWLAIRNSVACCMHESWSPIAKFRGAYEHSALATVADNLELLRQDKLDGSLASPLNDR